MMFTRIVLIALSFVILLTACQPVDDAPHPINSPTDVAPADTTRPAAAPDQPPVLPNLLVLAEAQVEVRRKDSITPIRVALGTELQPGDTVMVQEGQAAIFCGAESDWNNNPRPLSVGTRAGVPCGAGRPPRPYPDAALVRSRGGEESTTANEIYILSPRSGWVLTDRPTLVWHEIAGAASYTVTLESDDGVTRTIIADGSPLPYPAAWEPLQADGASYRLVVATADKTSGEETPGFSLLEDQAAFLDRVHRLEQRSLPEPAHTLLLAELYLSRALRSEAVDLLTALPNADQIIAVQGLLGETNLNMGLVDEGQAAYSRMLELAQAQGFIESQAQALIGLGFAACAQPDFDAVTGYWSQAHDLLDQHGLTTQGESIQKLLREIDKTCS
jgi:hypothetical protein